MTISGIIRYSVLALFLQCLSANASYHTADRLNQTYNPNRSISHSLDGYGYRLTDAITDATGAVTSRYTWDTWGNLQQQTGSSQQPFGFTGYQRDEQTGLHYAQQRYYDAEIGRFNRHDPFRGDINIPLSLHRYLYANANPTIFVDPDGRKTSFDIRFTAREKALLSGELSEQEFFEQNAAEAKGAIAGASVLAGGVGVGLGVRAGIAALSTAIAEIRSLGLFNAVITNPVTINTAGTEATIAAAAVTTGAEIPLNAPVTAARQLTTKLAQSAQKARETVKSGAFLVTESQSGVSNVLNIERSVHNKSVAETGVVANSFVVNPGRRVKLETFENGQERFRDLTNGNIVARADVTPSDLARGFQGSGNFPGVDRFRDVIIKRGQRIVTAQPGLSGFSTTLNGLARSSGDAQLLARGTQVTPGLFDGMLQVRKNAGVFEILSDQLAAVGIARANSQIGDGGFPQVFLPTVQLEINRIRNLARQQGRRVSDQEIIKSLEGLKVLRQVDSVILKNNIITN